jgi:hypothetical protein
MAFMGAYVGFVMPILAGFIERPFFTLAGVREGALWHSIGSNLVSAILLTIVGFFSIAIIWPSDVLELLWIPFALVLGTCIEYGWISFQRRSRDGSIRFSWLLVGNVASALLIMLLPVAREVIGPVDYTLQRWIWRNTAPIALLTLLACGVTYIYVFSQTGIFPPRQRGRGFEVLPSPTPAVR